jgi:hypothetical protein
MLPKQTRPYLCLNEKYYFLKNTMVLWNILIEEWLEGFDSDLMVLNTMVLVKTIAFIRFLKTSILDLLFS